MNSKPATRREIRSLLRSAKQQDIDSASERICQHLLQDCPEIRKAASIAVFSAHGPEVRLDQLHQLLPAASLLYPLCHSGGRLSFHQVTDISELAPGTLGILEPDPNQHKQVAIPDIDVFICPGLAFGRDHSRLGHGGGFYDRALHQKAPHAAAIGVAMHSQIVDSAPHHDHDIPMDRIITELGLLD